MAQKTDPLGCLTHFKTGGTFYEFGYNVGAQFRERIQTYFNTSPMHQEILLPVYNSPAGRDYYEESLRVSQDCYPQYVRELRGMADGAGLPFEHVFMANMAERNLGSVVKGKAANQEQKNTAHDFGCSTFFINSRETKLIVHNEDHGPLVKKYCFLVSADIEEGEQKEKFTAFCCPGNLPGRSFSVNHHGVVFASEVLRPVQTVRGAPSRYFVTRALTGATRNIKDGVRLAQNSPYGCAYGFSANLSTREGHMASLEIAPGTPQALVHVQDVTCPSDDPDAVCHYFRFNSYKHLKVEEGDVESSIRRAQRARQLPAPLCLQQALDMAADRQDSEHPIFRVPSRTDGSETLCTAVFDILANELKLYNERDQLLSNTPALTLPMY